MPDALMLCPETPYPIAGGGALRTASLVEYLGRRYALDLIVFREPGRPDPRKLIPAGLVRNVSVIDLPTNGRSFAARAIRNSGRMIRRVPPLVDRFAGFEGEVTRALQGRSYDVGIVEHSWAAGYVDQFAPVCRRTVLDLHNVESTWHERCAQAERGPAALAHRVFRNASLELERSAFLRFSTVLATSENDAALVRAIAPAARVVVYPNALPSTPNPPTRDEEAIVFSGNMEYQPNITAVRFFRRDIWPQLRERWPGLVWRLVGKNPGAVATYTSGDARIEVIGPVDDAVDELAKSRIAVVPLLTGSGTRLKILEGWAAGLPVVSTSLGAEGLGAVDGTTLLLADDAKTFTKAVTRLLGCSVLRHSLSEAGRCLLLKEFTWETAWKKLDF